MKDDYGTLQRHVIALPLEAIMLVGAGVTAYMGNWKHFAISVFTFVISFLPLVVERAWRVRLPLVIQTLFVGFIFASMFTGEVLGMYGRIWAWDDVMHGLSGVLIGIGGALWLTWLLRDPKRFRMPVWFRLFVVVALAALVAVTWELVEFGSDELFGTFSQGGDLFDTMMDFVYGMGGGVIAAAAWYGHLRGWRIPGMAGLVGSFVKRNA